MNTSERGTVTLFVAVVAVGLIMVAGMAYDGGSVLTAHARARDVAAGAARAAAQELDTAALRLDGTITLDADAAARAADRYLARAGMAGTVDVDADTVTVEVTTTHAMRILPLPARTVTAQATAKATAALGGVTP